MFKHAVTLPGLSLKVLFQFIPKTINMPQIYKNERMRNDDDNSLYNEWKQNLYGGLSIIFHRFHSKDVTFIKNNQNEPCRRILGLDCTNCYGATVSQTFPPGLYCKYFCFDNFSHRKVVPYGFEAVNRFHYVMYSEKHFHSAQI